MTSTTLDCPQCGEQNPREAVMCWACYTPLASEAATRNDKKGRLEITIHREAKEVFRDLLLCASLSLCVASGYLPHYSLMLLASGVLCVALLVAWTKWGERVTPRQNGLDKDEEPLEKILDTVLLYGVRDGATQVRLRAGIGVRFDYLIDGEWHDQMRIPSYVWQTLHPLLVEKTDNWQSPIPFAIAAPDGLPFDCWPEYKVDPEYPIETVLLTLRQTLPPRPKTTESELT